MATGTPFLLQQPVKLESFCSKSTSVIIFAIPQGFIVV
jgi:hypothetical protein